MWIVHDSMDDVWKETLGAMENFLFRLSFVEDTGNVFQTGKTPSMIDIVFSFFMPTSKIQPEWVRHIQSSV